MEKDSGRLFSLSKKKLPWLVVLFLLGVVLLAAGDLISEEEAPESPVIAGSENKEYPKVADQKDSTRLTAVEEDMEKRLETALAAVEGVGSVSVTVSLENGSQRIYATNASTNERKIEETDSNGGRRVTTETTENDQMVLAQPAGAGGEEAVVVKEIRPEIAGVLVVAEGAENADVKVTLSTAVQTLLDIPAHKVSILPRVREQ